MSDKRILRINGKTQHVEADPDKSLLSVLREDLELTGSKYGCGEGQCGACTVLIDGRATRSCITPVGAVGTGEITTIEGLERDGKLHPVQEAFLSVDALQCGYCTSGMIMEAAALLKTTPSPSREEISRAMQGNICRCGTYDRIIQAVQAATGRPSTARRESR